MQIHFALAPVLYSLRASGSLATIGHLLDSADFLAMLHWRYGVPLPFPLLLLNMTPSTGV